MDEPGHVGFSEIHAAHDFELVRHAGDFRFMIYDLRLKTSRRKLLAIASALNCSNTARWPACPNWPARGSSSRRPSMASARACGFPGSHNMPPPEAATNSGNA